MCVYNWITVVQLKLTQHCQSAVLQYKIKTLKRTQRSMQLHLKVHLLCFLFPGVKICSNDCAFYILGMYHGLIRGSKYKWQGTGMHSHCELELLGTYHEGQGPANWEVQNLPGAEEGRGHLRQLSPWETRCRYMNEHTQDHKGTGLARLLRHKEPWQPSVTLPPVTGCHLRFREVQWSVNTTQQYQPGHLNKVPALLGCLIRTCSVNISPEEAEVQKWEGGDPNKK